MIGADKKKRPKNAIFPKVRFFDFSKVAQGPTQE